MAAQENTAAVLPFEKPKAPPSLGAIMAGAAKAEPKAKKSSVVVIGDAPDNVKEAADSNGSP